MTSKEALAAKYEALAAFYALYESSGSWRESSEPGHGSVLKLTESQALEFASDKVDAALAIEVEDEPKPCVERGDICITHTNDDKCPTPPASAEAKPTQGQIDEALKAKCCMGDVSCDYDCAFRLKHLIGVLAAAFRKKHPEAGRE